MIDTHCHLTYTPLCDRIDEVIDHAAGAGVHRMICVGTTPPDVQAALALADRFPQVDVTAGVHPGYSADWRDENSVKAQLRELLAHPRVVAVGEMGLDQHHPEPDIEIQQPAFEWQLELMRETNLPGVIHSRKATDRTLATLRASGLPGDRFVFHCFTGQADELQAILDFGAMVSFTGVVTFKSNEALAQCADSVPLDRLMIETDSPYLTPEPFRKIRTNEPKYVAQVASFLAARRGMPMDDFVQAVDGNAMRFFRLAPL